MKSRILLAAVTCISLSGLAYGQKSDQNNHAGTGAPDTGSSMNQANPTTPDTGSAATPGSTGTSGSTSDGMNSGQQTGDAMGNMPGDQNRSMQRGAMGSDADMKAKATLEKIAQTPDKAGDMLFVAEAAMGNLHEVEFARLAQQKASDSQVKELAKMIEQDHQAANEKLRPIAQKMGLEIPTELPSAKQQKLAIYNAMSGQDFDKAYVSANRADHAKDIVAYTDEMKDAKDGDLKAYVAEVLPKLKQHGSHVNQLASKMGYASAGSDMSNDIGERAAERQREQAPGVTPQSPDPVNPVNNQNPSNR